MSWDRDWRAPRVVRVAVLALVIAAAGALGACGPRLSTLEERQEALDNGDRFENVNRAIFEVNRTIDETLLKPAAIIYRGVVPEWGRDKVSNFLGNLGEPVTFFNDLLQAEWERAGVSLGRFLLNSTVGVFGFVDVAVHAGLEKHTEDFGQTLAVWGVPEGPYLVLPLFGPSNPRDAIGLVADFLMDPFGYILDEPQRYQRFGLSAVSARAAYLEQLETIERTSVDFYAALRNLYREKRANDIRNGQLPDTEALPSLDIERVE
jgi:phospholipid-binding lipoprotein MlaA